MRTKRIACFYLILSLLLCSVNVFGAGENERASLSGESIYADEIGSGSGDLDGTDPEELKDPEGISAALLAEAAALQDMEPGVDYCDREGVFLSDSYEEALSIAAGYRARLISFERGIATVEFSECTVDAFTEAAEGGEVTKYIEPNYLFELDDPNETDLSSVLDQYAKDGSDEGAFILSSPSNGKDTISTPINAPDPFLSEDSGCYQYGLDKIKAKNAWNITSGKGIRVGVIDTGVNFEHEDLKGRVSVNCISSLAATLKPQFRGLDVHGHGTHVCGVIAAIKDNGLGGCGVAHGVSVDSIQVTVTGKSFKLSDVADGVRMAMELGDDVINMSLGSDKNSEVLRQVLDEAYSRGVVLVAAAGNQGNDVKHYPAAYTNVISVGATTINGHLASFSNYGDWVNLAAPGASIYSTYIYSASQNSGVSKNRVSGNSNRDSYGKLKGTSQATPYVAGTAALVYASNPELFRKRSVDTAAFVQEIICSTDDKKDYLCDGNEEKKVVGFLQADSAVMYAHSLTSATNCHIRDKAGHHGSILSGYISKGKSIKLTICDVNGNKDKSLSKQAVWSCSNPDKISVKNGKIKCKKDAVDGDSAIICAAVGSDTLYYALTVQRQVKKMGVRNGYSFKTSDSVGRKAGKAFDISDPCSAVSKNSIYVSYASGTKAIREDFLGNTDFAGKKYRYDIVISKKDLSKLNVLEYDSNGDPLMVSVKEPGKLKIRYKMLDGSGKSFTVKVNVS